MHEEEDIEMTPSYRGSESKGEFFGLPGNTSYPIIASFGIGMLFLMGGIVSKTGYVKSFVMALVPVVLTSAVVFTMVHKKPKGYLGDFLSQMLTGNSMTFNRRTQERFRPPPHD